jgi:hypothetical protein
LKVRRSFQDHSEQFCQQRFPTLDEFGVDTFDIELTKVQIGAQMITEPSEDRQDTGPVSIMIKRDEWFAGKPFRENRKAPFSGVAQLFEPRSCLFHSDQLQGVGFGRDADSIRNPIASELPMVDIDPFDLVAESSARSRPVF